MNAQQVAELYQRGGELTDMQIAELSETDREAWFCAVDPSYRELFLPKQKQPSKGAQLGKQMLDAVTRYVTRACTPLAEKIKQMDRRQQSTDELLADLEARISQLEQRR